MLDNEKNEVIAEKEVVEPSQKREAPVFHYDDHVSCAKGNVAARDILEMFFSKKIIKIAIPLILSAFLLCVSFLPFLTIEGRAADNKTYSVSFSCVDCVDLSVKSLYSLSDEELMETDLAKELLRGSRISSDERLKKQVLLAVMSEDMPITPSVIALGVISLLYIGVCALIGIISLFKLFLLFVSKSNKEQVGHQSDSLFCFLLCMIPLWLYCSLQSGKALRAAAFPTVNGDGSESVALGALATIGLLCVATATVFFENLLRMTSRSEWNFKRVFNKYSLSIVLAVTVIVLVFAPCLQLSGSNGTGFGYGDFVEISDSTLNEYADISSQDSYEMLTEYAKANKVAADRTEHVMELLTIGYCRIYINPLYMAFNILSMVVLVVAGLFLWQIMQKAFWDKNNRRKINRSKVMLMLGVLAYFLMLMVWTVWINLNLINQTPSVFRLAVGTAPIAMLIVAMATLFCPVGEDGIKARKVRKKKRIK